MYGKAGGQGVDSDRGREVPPYGHGDDFELAGKISVNNILCEVCHHVCLWTLALEKASFGRTRVSATATAFMYTRPWIRDWSAGGRGRIQIQMGAYP